MADLQFPKIVWHYWGQGWENAPYPVQECYKSVYHYASDWEIVDLDDSNINNYIDIPAEIREIPNFPIQPISDIIRLFLLKNMAVFG